MDLETQIKSIIISFVLGLFYSLLFNIFHFLLYSNNKVIKITFTIVFNMSLMILFFYVMYLINYADIHPYFVFLLVAGFILGNIKTKNVRINAKKRKRG